ncbi:MULTISPECIES: hypothetical protein [Ureibacillus]|uniref:ECF transporter S component n=1 Tax=Ureibacillus terrenus TaxID=118246 RepID=A0A540UX23_9BACL|nr:hypothetical protein [Ureibacillus terrenus]MED3662819.1 hypothetical protein [Ureibacillus terrenus]TQE89021.1 hypothetical protein FKZ59_12845 [Ureibacillus terrenus]
MIFISIIKGIIVGVITAFVVPFICINGLSGLYGGLYNVFGSRWTYIAYLIAIIPTFGYVGFYFSNKSTLSNRHRWKVSAISVFIISIIANSVGLLIGYILVLGSLETVNVEEVVPFMLLLGTLLLPITIPLGKFILDILYRWIHKIPFSTSK